MAIKFSQFQTGTTSDTNAADYLVGYESTLENIAGGERKFTLSTIANAVSGLIKTEMANFMNNTLTLGNYPYLEYAWVTAPNTAAQTINGATNTYQILTLTNIVQDTGNLQAQGAAIASNIFTLPAGTYQFKGFLKMTDSGGTNSNDASYIFALYNRSDSQFITRAHQKINKTTYSSYAEIEGQFKITSSKNFDLRVLCGIDSGRDHYVASWNSSAQPFPSQTDTTFDQRTTIKLWKVG